MAKRPITKKVIIRLELRNPGDPVELLQSVEDAFRAGDRGDVFGLHDDRATGDAPIDLSLESKARGHAARVLDQWDASARRSARRSTVPTPVQNPTGWLNRARANGWRIVVRLRDDSGSVDNTRGTGRLPL